MASNQGSGYFIDAENAAEMARLTKQGQLVTKEIGLIPALIDLSEAQNILDIACGPGEWALEVAQRFPDSQVYGIDISHVMTDYANVHAQQQKLSNAHFQVMDARSPLDFPDASFDVIHARLMGAFHTTTSWQQVIQECYRLLRPGGVFCNSEVDQIALTNSPSLTGYNSLLIEAMRRVGQTFTSEGNQTGLTAVHARLFRLAGFENIQHQGHVINYSMGTPAHPIMLDDFRTGLKLLQPFLTFIQVATQDELDVLYERTIAEMQLEDFCAVWIYQTTWGEKQALHSS